MLQVIAKLTRCLWRTGSFSFNNFIIWPIAPPIDVHNKCTCLHSNISQNMISFGLPIPVCEKSSFLVNLSPTSVIRLVKQKKLSASACSAWIKQSTIIKLILCLKILLKFYLSILGLDAEQTHSRLDQELRSCPAWHDQWTTFFPRQYTMYGSPAHSLCPCLS